MISRFLQSALCIFLSPVLVAEQVAQLGKQGAARAPVTRSAAASPLTSSGFVTLTKYAEIDLVALDPVSSATSKVGSEIHFRVSQDVVVQGTVVIPAGAILTGTIENVTIASKKRNRDGLVKIRINALRAANGQTLRFTGKSQQQRIAEKQSREDTVVDFLLLPLFGVICPFILLMAIGMWNEGNASTGNDVDLAPCFRVSAYTAATTKIRTPGLPLENTELNNRSGSSCSSTWNLDTREQFRLKIE